MPFLIPLGRSFLAIALVGWGVQNIIYADFVLGRAPAWPGGTESRLVFAAITAAFFITAGLGILFQRATRFWALLAAAMIALWPVARHVIAFVPHPNWGGPLTDIGKAFTLLGGLLAIAATATPETPDVPRALRPTPLLWVARICLSVFMINCGIQHFMWAAFVKTLVPAWAGNALAWTYCSGGLLIAGGVGMLLPRVARLAAGLSGLMIFLWFATLHVPRAVAFPDSKSDWLAVFESLGFSGIAFMIAGMLRVRPVRASGPASDLALER